MNTTKPKLSDRRQKQLENKNMSKIFSDWAGKNKKVFWKYEVSCFYKTYKIKVNNLPKPSTQDVLVSSNNRLLNDQQKTELCNALIKACAKTEVFNGASIDVQIDYDNGLVVAEVI